ncbi:MAG: hypothetical protein ACPLZC_05290 [Candidatus Bathyarchaeales archaeon]
MSSHYIKCVVKSSFENVFGVLSKAFGNVYAKKFDGSREPSKGIVLGEEYFLRVNSDVAILIILEELSAEETQAEVISCAGGAGLFNISYNAHSAYTHKVRDFLTSSGFQIEIKDEIPYFTI